MSAIIVCGKRSSFFEEIPTPCVSSKRARCSSSSPVRFSPPRSSFANSSPSAASPSLVDHLISVFPDMERELLEKTLENCGNDLDLAIKSLNQLRLGCAESNLGNAAGQSDMSSQDSSQPANGNGGVQFNEDPTILRNLPLDGAEWVEIFVREMMNSSDLDDAKIRASRALAALENSISARVDSEAAKNIQQENIMLKRQIQLLAEENTLLKRAVSIQHERQKDFDEKCQELQNLKQLVAQYQEQLRTLEVNNYALAMHLKQAQQNNSMPGRFHPDVF